MSATMTHERIEPRTRRAATESMVVHLSGPGVFEVYSGTETYRVFAPGAEWRCECDDHHHRHSMCKHIRRVQMTIGERAVPDVTGVDLVLHKQRGDA